MSRIKRDHAVIEYRVAGKGEPTLLFVHGSFIDQDYWKEQVDYFSKDYRVATLDLPGHGKSGREREPWSMRGFAEDVSAVIDELGSDSIILIGHSAGADINLMAAVMHPESVLGFIGIDVFKNAGTPLPERYRAQVGTMLDNLKTDFAGTNEGYARMALLTERTPPDLAARVIGDYRNAYRPMGLATIPEIFAMDRVERDLLPRLALKLYLINVEYMPTNEEPLRRYARNGYEVTRIPGTCHFPMLENPGALNAALEQVIRKIPKPSAVF